MGYIYLLHFSKPISPNHTTQHYIGYTENLTERITQHKKGHGARLTAVAYQRGIRFKVARIWIGPRDLERKIKNMKNTPHLCPICNKKNKRAKFTQYPEMKWKEKR